MDQSVVLATKRADMPHDVTATTPAGFADVRVVVMTAAAQVGVRTARTYLQGFLGFLFVGAGIAPGGEVAGVAVPPLQLWQVVVGAAGLALFPALVAVVQNVIELLTQLDTRAPELRG